MDTSPNEFVFKPEGEGSDAWAANLVADAWGQQPLLQHRPLLEFFLINDADLKQDEIYEWVVRDLSGRAIAGIVASENYDQHVGRCLNVRWAISTEAGLLTKGYRKLFELAKYLELPYISYTREISPSVYEMRYKKVKLHD